jgi:DNA-binding transcriptional MerR regulator
MGETIKSMKAQKYVGTAQLADEAARLISQLVPRQERGSVSELPDERTVRYYSAEGLLSPPEARQGTASVYGYGHLLQLLVIKRLQADGLPIRKIKEMVEGKSERELEQLIEVESAPRPAAAAKNSATEYLRSLLGTAASKGVPKATIAHARAAATPPPAAAAKSAWARVEVEPGLELHIREDYRLPDDAKDRKLLARRMLNEIESHGVKPRK